MERGDGARNQVGKGADVEEEKMTNEREREQERETEGENPPGFFSSSALYFTAPLS